MKQYAEKRDFLRMALDCTLSYGKPDEPKNCDGQVINLSNHGILFSTRYQTEVGAELEILLTPSNPMTESMQARVKVSRVKHIPPVYDVACEMGEIK